MWVSLVIIMVVIVVVCIGESPSTTTTWSSFSSSSSLWSSSSSSSTTTTTTTTTTSSSSSRWWHWCWQVCSAGGSPDQDSLEEPTLHPSPDLQAVINKPKHIIVLIIMLILGPMELSSRCKHTAAEMWPIRFCTAKFLKETTYTQWQWHTINQSTATQWNTVIQNKIEDDKSVVGWISVSVGGRQRLPWYPTAFKVIHQAPTKRLSSTSPEFKQWWTCLSSTFWTLSLFFLVKSQPIKISQAHEYHFRYLVLVYFHLQCLHYFKYSMLSWWLNSCNWRWHMIRISIRI